MHHGNILSCNIAGSVEPNGTLRDVGVGNGRVPAVEASHADERQAVAQQHGVAPAGPPFIRYLETGGALLIVNFRHVLELSEVERS